MKKFIFPAIAALIPSVASAEGFYVGALYGSTTIDTGVSAVSGATLDEDGTGSSFFIGSEMNENFSIEGFYTDFGEASLKGDSGDTFVLDGTTYSFNTSATIKVSGTTKGVAGKLHFDMAEKLRGFVKGGMHWWDAEVELSVGTASATATDDGTDIIMGVGMDYQIGENVAFLVGYDNYTVDSESVTFLSGGIKVRF